MRVARFAAVVFGFFVPACTIHPVFTLKPFTARSAVFLAIEDRRPESEKESEILSLFATSCEYGIAQMGDDKTVPDRTTYLKQALSGVLGDRLAGRRITLKSFAIYRNNQVSLRNGNPAHAGLLTAAIANSIECYATKEQRGGYNPDENPDGDNAVVIDLRINVDEKEFRSRVVEPAPGTVSRFGGTPEIWEEGVGLAMREVVNRLARQIQRSGL